jgi:hypothetical protein
MQEDLGSKPGTTVFSFPLYHLTQTPKKIYWNFTNMGWMEIGHKVYHSLNFRLKKNGSLVGSLHVFN